LSAPIRSRLLTGTPVEEHGLLMPVPWIRVPVAAAGDTATLTVLAVSGSFPAAVATGEVNATATLTVLAVTGNFPAVVALSGVAATLTALQVQATFPTVAATGVNETASWGMIPIGVA